MPQNEDHMRKVWKKSGFVHPSNNPFFLSRKSPPEPNNAHGNATVNANIIIYHEGWYLATVQLHQGGYFMVGYNPNMQTLMIKQHGNLADNTKQQ